MAKFVWPGRTVWWLFYIAIFFIYILIYIYKTQCNEQHEQKVVAWWECILLLQLIKITANFKSKNFSFFIYHFHIYFHFAEVTCPIPGIKNGIVSSSTLPQFQEILTVSCVVGYMINGSTDITCGKDRSFDVVPNCFGELLLINL